MPAQRFLAGMTMGQRADAPRGLFPTKAQGVLTVPLSALPRGMRLGKLASKFEQMLNLCDPKAVAPAEPSYTPRLFPVPRDAAPVKKTPCKGLALAQSAASNNQEAAMEFEAMFMPDSIASASMLEAPSKVSHHASKFEQDHASKTLGSFSDIEDQHVLKTSGSFSQAELTSAFERKTSKGDEGNPALPSLAKFGSQHVEPPKEDAGAVAILQEERDPAQANLSRHNLEELDLVQNPPMEDPAIDRFEEQIARASRWSSKEATSRKGTKELFGHASTPTPPNEEVAASLLMEKYHQEMSTKATKEGAAVSGQRSRSARENRPKRELTPASRPWDDAPKGQPERPPPLPPWPHRRCNPAVLPRASKRCGSPPAETIKVSPAPPHSIQRAQRARNRSGARFSAGRRRRDNESPVLEINPNGILDFPSYAIPRYYEEAKVTSASNPAGNSRSPSPSHYCRYAASGERDQEHQRPRSVNEASTPSTYLPTTPTNSKPSSPRPGATPTDPLRSSRPEREPPSPPPSPSNNKLLSARSGSRNLDAGSSQELDMPTLPGRGFRNGNLQKHPTPTLRPSTPVSPTSPDGRPQTPDSPAFARPSSPDSEQDQQPDGDLLGRHPATMIRTNTLEDLQPSFGPGLSSYLSSKEKADSDMDPRWTKEAASTDEMICAPSIAELASQKEIDDELLNASVGSLLPDSGVVTKSRLWNTSEQDVDSLAEASLQVDLGEKEAEPVD